MARAPGPGCRRARCHLGCAGRAAGPASTYRRSDSPATTISGEKATMRRQAAAARRNCQTTRTRLITPLCAKPAAGGPARTRRRRPLRPLLRHSRTRLPSLLLLLRLTQLVSAPPSVSCQDTYRTIEFVGVPPVGRIDAGTFAVPQPRHLADRVHRHERRGWILDFVPVDSKPTEDLWQQVETRLNPAMDAALNRPQPTAGPAGDPELEIPSGQFKPKVPRYTGAGATSATSASCSRTGRPSQ